MFDLVTKHKRIIQVVLGLLILPFAFFGVESYTRAGRSSQDAASVDGTAVTLREYSEETRRQQDRLRQVLGQGADLAAFDTPEMRLAILDSLVSQRLMTNEVVNSRLMLSKEEVVAAILAAPEFQENGKFSAERYAGYLRSMSLSDEGNVMKLRVEIPAARLASLVAGSAIQPKAVAQRMAAAEAEKREVAEAFIPSENFVARVKPEESAMRAYYDSHPADFKVAERLRAEYAVLSAEDMAATEAVTEEELKKAYQDAPKGRFTTAEQRRASHILVKTKEEAEKILAEARKAPQQFAELAKKNSLETDSAPKGGDLGMNEKGALAAKELDEAVFKLKPGEMDVVQTQFGYHVVRLVEVQPGKTRTLEEARKDLTAEIGKQKAAKKFAEAADGFNNLVYEQSDSLKPVAEKYKLKIASTGWFTRQGGADIGPLTHPKLLAALFSADRTLQKRNTDAIEVAPGVLVAARVVEHQPEAQRPYEEVKAEVAKRLARREAAAMAKKEGEQKLAELAKGGDAGLSWGAAKTVTRQESQGLPRDALRKVMSADPAKLPAHAGAERGEEGYALYRVTKVIPGEPKAGKEAVESQVRYDRQAGSEQLDAYVAALRARSKIEVYTSNLERK